MSMVITDMAQVNAIGCCPCDYQTCANPREECESASVVICAYTPDNAAPAVHDVSEEGGILYQTIDYSYSGSGSTDTDEYTSSDNLNQSHPRGQLTGGLWCWTTVSWAFSDETTSWFTSAKETILTKQNNVDSASGTDEGSGVAASFRNFGYENDSGGTEIDSWDDTSTGTFDVSAYNFAAVEVGGDATWTGPVLVYDAVPYTIGEDSATVTLTFSDAYTQETAAAVLNAVEIDPEDYTGESCVASLTVTLAADGTRLKSATGTRVRYRRGVPENYSTTESPRSTWEMQWDEISASAEWWEWFDGGMSGDEPTPGPTLESSRSWTWGGSMATEDDQFSDYYELPIPEVAGETRVCNTLITCWKSARIGQKPTAYGDQVAID